MQENSFDKGCRYLAKLDPVAILAWLLRLSASAFVFVRWLDTRRLPFPGQPDRTCDTVAHLERIDDNHRPWAVVVEFNIDPDALMFGRVLGYLGTLWIEEKPSTERGDRFEIGCVVVNLTGRAESSRCSDWQAIGMRSELRVVERNLSTLQAGDVLQTIVDNRAPRVVLPWIPLMQGGGESAIIARWKDVAATEPDAQRRADYGALAEVFAEAVGYQGIWHDELKEWNMIESKVVKEWQERGRREERRETSLQSLLAVLRKKFGPLPEDVPPHLTAIDDASVLQGLLLKAIDVGSLAEFQREIPNGTK